MSIHDQKPVALCKKVTASGKGPAKGRKSNRNPSPTEFRLQTLWKYLLRNPRVGLDDNFFLLGGDSLQAVELFLQMEKVFKRRLPVSTLFKAGTVAEMAALIESGEPEGAMVPIQTDGDRPPFFCVHAQDGHVMFLYQLSRHIGAEQSLYGIQSVGWDKAAVPFTRAKDMAAHYVAEMRKVQPEGPYFIGGYSSGGLIAVYMAHMLKAAGEKVAFLGLLDTLAQFSQQVMPLGPWLEKQGRPVGAKKAKAVWFYARRRLTRGYQRCRGLMARLVLFPVLELCRASGKPPPRFLCRPDLCNDLMRAKLRDIPIYEGDAVYFKAESDPRSIGHPDRRDGWGRIIKGKLEYIPASGGHLQMMADPHVQSLADELTQALERARKG